MSSKYIVALAIIACRAICSQGQVTVDGCDATKTCFRDPPGCSIDNAACRFISWRKSTEGGYDFEMSGGVGGGQEYIAFALGLNNAMETADMYYCDGTEVRSGVIQGLHNSPEYLAMEEGLETKGASTVNGVGQCTLGRPASVIKNISDSETKDFDITNEEFYLLVASGEMLGERIRKHTWKTASDAKYDFSAVLSQSPVTSEGCGSTKNCFKDPENCNIEDPGCRYYSWRKDEDGSSYDFEMSGGSGNGLQYIALALGLKSQMQDADLYYCDGTAVRSGAIQALHNPPAYYEMTNGLATLAASTVNGVAKCIFRRPASVTKTISGGTSEDFDITKNEYYLLGAIGPMNGSKIERHNVWRTVTNETFNFASEIMEEDPITPSGCGETKTCYRNPENCEVGTANCRFYSWTKVEDGTYNFEMAGSTGDGQNYVAFALGTKSAMQDADLYYCDGETIRSGAIQDLHKPPAYLEMNNGLKTVSASTVNGVAQCVLNRPATVTKEISGGVMKSFDLNSEKYYLLAAIGEMNGAQVRKHTWAEATKDRIVSSASRAVILHPVMLGLLSLLAVKTLE